MSFRILCTEGQAVYIWQSGDSAEGVAARFGTTPDALLDANPGRNVESLQPGDLICVPTANLVCPDNDTYEVRSGDTLMRIARQLNVPLGRLTELNPYIDPDRLSVGQILCVPKRPASSDSPEAAACPEGAVRRAVRFGDTLARILDRYDVSYEAFRALNPSLNEEQLLPGQPFCVPAAQQRGACDTPGAQSYTWSEGDSMAVVAARFRSDVGELLRMNPSLRPSEFTPGQVICVPSK